ncbi:hypothetical protein [Microseira sp. BLCC-F43]
MSNESEGATELSSHETSQIRLIGWSQKAMDLGSAVPIPTDSTPDKPGR